MLLKIARILSLALLLFTGCAIVWMIVTYVPGLAIMAYRERDAMLGAALAASGVTALIALGVVWTAKATTREEPRTAGQT